MEVRELMRIPYFSLTDLPSEIKAGWSNAVIDTISSGRFIGGREVQKFESNFANYLGIKNVIGVGNGYDALVIALKALGIGHGDRVVVPAHTFIATWLAVAAVGAEPVGIDCDEHGLLDLDLIERLNPHPDAIIPVHMHGAMVDMERLTTWAHKFGVYIIEDCAQAHGASQSGKKSGSWGDVSAFSFYPTKNLGALGDGGAVVTNNSELAEKLRAYANYGSSVKNKYEYEQLGINSRLDSIQSAILNFNLSHLESWNGRRNEIAKIYINALADKYKILHQNQKSVWHHFVILVERRDELQQHLANSGIGTEIHYPKVAGIQYQTLKNNLVTTNWENASRISASALSLPISPWLKNEEIKDVISAIHFFR
jgi:dTDP-4-amino-4,6-dideoxygalactose transaminase